MVTNVFVFCLGLALLVFGADRFVTAAAALAKYLRVSPLMIGTILVGFSTALPELIVSFIAAWRGHFDLSVGNVLGSYVANIGLVLGFTALIKPLIVSSDILKREIPIMVTSLLLAFILFADGSLGRNDGYVLLFFFVLFIFGSIVFNRKDKNHLFTDNQVSELIESYGGRWFSSITGVIFWLLCGFILLYLGSRLIVTSSVNIATLLGVSDFVIGLTVVAVGTSLPELAASIVSALRGEHDIAVGNAIGSNVFCILGVLAVPAIISPDSVAPFVLWREFGVMMIITTLLWIMSARFDKTFHINRIEGSILLSVFIIYMLLLAF